MIAPRESAVVVRAWFRVCMSDRRGEARCDKRRVCCVLLCDACVMCIVMCVVVCVVMRCEVYVVYLLVFVLPR